MDEKTSEMVKRAIGARERAYCPYSHFAVGACVECEDGSLFDGCNIENASYGATNCAERTAVFKAVSEGHTRIVRIALAGGREGEAPAENIYPCGICRQVLSEFASEDMEIILAQSETEIRKTTLEKLLPDSFGAGNL